MTRVLTAVLMLGLLIAPGVRPVAASDEVTPVPASSSVECPPVEIVNGVPVIPEGAPAECVYIQTVDAEDPCAPDATGASPEMCQSGLPVDPPVGGDACWITSDGSTNCPRTGGEIPLAYGRHFAVIAVSLSGVRYEVAAGQMYLGDDGSFSATVGCNQLGGTVTTNSDGTFTVSDLLSTKMYCEELSAAETTFSAILLGGALTFSQTEAGLVAQNGVGTLELIEAMYDAVPTNGEERANIDGVGASSDLSALLIAMALFGIPALVGAAGVSVGLSRRG
ncbi:MAG: META domain-containing protein [Chloroflexi bacterium]|nr:META domain-containing protein [Chloroflexota bacterium]